jgi:hypothetical protein
VRRPGPGKVAVFGVKMIVCKDGAMANSHILRIFVLTARQYGEVVLPDAASGQGPGTPPEAGPESCHGARRVRRSFCRPGTKFVEHYACRGTSLIGAANLSPVTELVAGSGAVSRYKVDRSQKTVKVY